LPVKHNHWRAAAMTRSAPSRLWHLQTSALRPIYGDADITCIQVLFIKDGTGVVCNMHCYADTTSLLDNFHNTVDSKVQWNFRICSKKLNSIVWDRIPHSKIRNTQVANLATNGDLFSPAEHNCQQVIQSKICYNCNFLHLLFFSKL